MSTPAREIILVTGLSGAGKASILRVLEDLGFETVDNPPISILESLVGDGVLPLAAGIDARTRDFDAAAVWPVAVTQVAGKSSGCGSGGWILVDATRGKRITSVKAARCFGPGKEDGDQSFAIHQFASGCEVIVHGSECFAAVQCQHQVISASVRTCRWQVRVEIVAGVTKHGQHFGQQGVWYRLAAGRW